jgi:hypothetical protein
MENQPEAGPGRPSKISKKLIETICERLIAGESLREICLSDGMPDKATVCRWLSRNEKFRDQYARARDMQAEMMADEILDIADDGRNDWMERKIGADVIQVVDQEAVQRSKLRVDARKWIAAKRLPKKYGEKVGVEHSGKVDVTVDLLDGILNDDPNPGEES